MLTKEIVLASKPNAKSIEEIKNINLWGNDLENIDIISEMKNLEVVSLSLNKIKTLKPFSNCPNLRELYLRKNNITDLSEIDNLKNCHNLKILWLEENPICQNSDYKEKIKSTLPQVVKLDNNLISSTIRSSIVSNENTNRERKESQNNKIETKKSNIIIDTPSNVKDTNENGNNINEEITGQKENINEVDEGNKDDTPEFHESQEVIDNMDINDIYKNAVENNKSNTNDNVTNTASNKVSTNNDQVYTEHQDNTNPNPEQNNQNNQASSTKDQDNNMGKTNDCNDLLNEALNNYKCDASFDTFINITKPDFLINQDMEANNETLSTIKNNANTLTANNSIKQNNASLTRTEEYLKKLDNIEDIKNYFSSPYSKNNSSNIGDQPVKLMPKLNEQNLNYGNNELNNYSNYRPISEQNSNRISQSRQEASFSVNDSLNNISPRNTHIVSAILNLMEVLNLRELIQIRDVIIQKLKK